MHQDLDRRIGDESGDRRDVDACDGIEDDDAGRGRDLYEAGHRRVRAFPQELGVEADSPGGARLVGKARDVGGGREVLDRDGWLSHGEGLYQNRR